MINRIILFLAVLTSINLCLVGLGVFSEATIYKMGVLDSTPEEVYSQAEYFTTVGNDIEDTGNASDSQYYTSVAPKSKQAYGNFSSLINLVAGLSFGYSALFVVLGLPTLLVWLFTSIIAIIQIVSVFYLIAYLIGIFRGASI